MLGRDVETTPGTPAAYHDHPIEFAQAIRRLLIRDDERERSERRSQGGGPFEPPHPAREERSAVSLPGSADHPRVDVEVIEAEVA